MGFLDEFKKFAVRGNMVDMAIGIAIGAAFNGAVNSLVNDIIMPPIGALLGDVDFSKYYINLSGGSFDTLADAQAAGAATINYGLFINNMLNLFIVALALFLVVHWFNRTRKEQVTGPEPVIRTCPYCQMDIPDRATRCPHCTSTLEA
jgi:large conductance mechanosensitive channel